MNRPGRPARSLRWLADEGGPSGCTLELDFDDTGLPSSSLPPWFANKHATRCPRTSSGESNDAKPPTAARRKAMVETGSLDALPAARAKRASGRA